MIAPEWILCYTETEFGITQEGKVYTAKVSSKGWVVIPKELRAKHGIEKGMLMQLIDYGTVLVLVPLPEDPVGALHGMLEEGPSLTETLLAERAQERAREQGRGG